MVEGRGGAAPLEELLAERLRRLARRARRRHPAPARQPTVLLQAALFQHYAGEPERWPGWPAFAADAAPLLRRLLMDRARARAQAAPAAPAAHDALDGVLDALEARHGPLALFGAALEQLERRDARLARIVDLRVFAGLTDEESAQALGLETGAARRGLLLARAWLRRELRRSGGGPGVDPAARPGPNIG